MISNAQSGTNIVEIAPNIYRINTPVSIPDGPGQFSFNQYLVLDEQPLLFHIRPRKRFPLTSEAIARVMPVERKRFVGLSHFEADECGAMNEFLAAAPQAVPLCGHVGALVSVNDFADRPARALADGETLVLGKHTMRWFDTPHLPHGCDCGLMMDTTPHTFFCGDLFTQPGTGEAPVTESDILGPSEAFRGHMDYYARAPDTNGVRARVVAERTATLACMHGSAWRGDGAALLNALAASLSGHRLLQAA